MEIKRLPRDKFKHYLYAPPLEVPGYSPEEAFKRGIETGDWRDYETAARRVSRLVIEAAEKNESVRKWLLATRVIGDKEWNKLIIALGRETPEIANQINELQPSHWMLNWSIFSAAYLVGGE